MTDYNLILPRELPDAPTASTNGAIPLDDGSAVVKVTPKKIVDAGRPFATQAQAEAGTDATVAMSPLTTKQAIEAVVPAVVQPYVEQAEAWAESPTPPDPGIPDSKSAKTWADEARAAEAGAVDAADRAEIWGARSMNDLPDLASDTSLTTANTAIGDTVDVRGLGTYIRVSSGGSITNANGLSFSPLKSFFAATPEMFGAKADGVADDTSAVQKALNASSVLSLTRGSTYKTTSPINVPSGSTIGGFGTLKPNGNFKAIIIGAGVSDVDISEISISGDLSTYTSPANDGIFIDWRTGAGANVRIRNAVVTGVAGAGIIGLASSSQPSRGIIITGCQVDTVGAHGIILQDYISDVIIRGNTVRKTGQTFPDRPGITASRHGDNVVVSDNICEGDPSIAQSSYHGISIDMSRGVTCSGNVVWGWSGLGIELAFVEDGTFTNNTVYNCGRGGVGVSGSVTLSGRSINCTISNNVVSDVVGAGIAAYMDGANGIFMHQNLSFIGNSVSRVTGTSIGVGELIQHVDGLTIDEASITDSSRSGIQIVDCKNISLDAKSVRGNNLVGGLKPVSSLTLNGGTTATATCSAHGYTSGDIVSIFGASPALFNAEAAVVTVVDVNTFTYTIGAISSTTATASGNIYAGKAYDVAHGGVKVQWTSLVPIEQRGFNRFGRISAYYNGYKNFYDNLLNGVSGVASDAMFIRSRPMHVRSESLTSGVPANANDGAAIYMRNGKIIIAYNNAGTINFLSIPLDGSTTSWTNSSAVPQ